MGPRAEQTPPVASLGAPGAQLWASDLCVDHVDDSLSISVSLHWDGSSTRSTLPSGRRLRMEIADLDRLGGDRRHLLAAQTPPNATPLVPLLAVIAATTGADLTIDGPVCPSALAGARRAIAVGQVTDGWPAVTLGATAGAAGPPQRGGTGLVFSLGLESLATLLELRGAGRAPTHLLAIDPPEPVTLGPSSGYHLTTSGAAAAGHRSWRAEAMAANATRLPLVRASTNVGDLALPGLRSTIAEQAIAAAGALALAGVVGEVTLPGVRPPGTAAPDTTSLWSSAAVELCTSTPRTSVTDASTLVAADEWALQWLRVCSSHRSEQNCGRCAPCQFTLTTLWLAGVSDGCLPGFAHGLDPAMIRALPPGHLDAHPDRHDHLELIGTLTAVAEGSAGNDGGDLRGDRFLAAALADAWSAHLERADAPVGAHALSA